MKNIALGWDSPDMNRNMSRNMVMDQALKRERSGFHRNMNQAWCENGDWLITESGFIHAAVEMMEEDLSLRLLVCVSVCVCVCECMCVYVCVLCLCVSR